MICRLVDTKNDGTKLVEYFDLDTNKFRLVVVSDGREHEIKHPNGKVKIFHTKVNLNKIKFDLDDSNFLIVNDEKFMIEKK